MATAERNIAGESSESQDLQPICLFCSETLPAPLLMWAGNRERALQSHLKGNVSWKRGIFNQRPGSKKKNIESEELPEWALLSRSIPVLTRLPPLIISAQFRSYIITAWISSLRFSSCTATLGVKSARLRWLESLHRHSKVSSARASPPGPQGTLLPPEQYQPGYCLVGSKRQNICFVMCVCATDLQITVWRLFIMALEKMGLGFFKIITTGESALIKPVKYHAHLWHHLKNKSTNACFYI